MGIRFINTWGMGWDVEVLMLLDIVLWFGAVGVGEK